MSSVEVRAVPPAAAENRPRTGKPAAAGPRRRGVLGEITNNKRTGAARAPVKPSGAQRAKPVVQVPVVPPPVVQVPVVQVPVVPPPVVPAPVVPAPVVPPPVVPAPVVQEPVDPVPEEDALCRSFSQTLLAVPDVDEQDADQPQLCSQYVKEIYAYLHVLEVQQPIRADYMQGYEISGRMRALLVDWLVQVHSRFQLLQETLYLTVAVLDRFLQVQPVSRRKLQLVGVGSMLVACKYEEMFAPEVGDFAYITDNAFTKAQILEMEQLLLRSLNFELGRPLPLHFLRRASKVADSDVQRHTLAKYLMELTLLDYHMVHYRPSEVASAALCLAQLLLDQLPWSPAQQHYSTYDQQHLTPLVQLIAKNVVTVNEGKTKFQAVKNKYSSSRLMKISLIPQLTSSVVQKLAAPLLDTA